MENIRDYIPEIDLLILFSIFRNFSNEKKGWIKYELFPKLLVSFFSKQTLSLFEAEVKSDLTIITRSSKSEFAGFYLNDGSE